MINNTILKIDVNNTNGYQKVIAIEHENDKNVRFIEVECYSSGEKIIFNDSAIAKAAFIIDDVLIDDSVSCEINSDKSTILIPIDNGSIKSKSGILGIEVSIIDGDTILTLPVALKVRIKSSVLNNAQVTENSKGTVAETIQDIFKAKGNFENLSAKLDNLSLNYITAEQFGAKGDGITDDTAALQAMFDYASKNNCAISLSANKIYIISNTLRYDTANANFDGNWATIKVVDDCPKREESYFISQDQQIKEQEIEGKWSLNSLITINITSGENARYNMGTFKQLIVDCNCGQAKHAIKIENEGKTNYAHIMVKNPALYGIRSYGGNEATFSYIHGCRSGVSELSSKLITKGWLSIDQRLHSTMLYLGCADTYVSDCVAVDFENGFLTGASDNHFNKCHAWCSNKNIMQCSASFIIWGGAATFIQCTVDSTKFGYKFYNRGCATVVGGMSAYNDIYKKNIENFGVPTLFYFEKESTYKSELVGLNTIISSSSFKTVEGLSCNFDNLTDENDNKLSIDYKPEGEFESVHVIELSDTYSKSEIDAELAKKINEEDVYTTEEADDHFQRILTAGDNIKIDDNKQGKITISADLSKKYDAANVESGSGDLS
ncbi:glycosyl hydrolase family 28-related protein, partial [Ruminococcus sp. YE282]|uniref:glycosyl hydrolase family 28-related protein n=1 Tax=Ruminococcus sp. YE282 TaxID=3158780 RepID=UPI0008818A35